MKRLFCIIFDSFFSFPHSVAVLSLVQFCAVVLGSIGKVGKNGSDISEHPQQAGYTVPALSL